MKKLLFYVVLCAVFLVHSSNLLGQQYTDEPTWLAAAMADCQSLVTEDFDGIPIVGVTQLYSTPSSPLAVAFGQITTPIIDDNGEDIFILRNDLNQNVFDSQALFMIGAVVKYDLIPTNSTGAVSLKYLGEMNVQIFDGNDLIFETDLSATNPSFFGWTDTTVAADCVVLNLVGASAAVNEVRFGVGCLLNPNVAPTADAGSDQTIRIPTIVLDGSGSFDDNTAQAQLVYNWSFVSKPTESAAVLDDPTSVTPSFVADIAGTYTLSLVVTDGQGLSSGAAQVQISSDNLAPTGMATPNGTIAVVGDVVQFDGSGSTDPDMDPISYQWNILVAPAGSTAELVGANTVNPTLTPDEEGLYSVTLVVSDFLGPGIPVQAEFTAAATTEIVIVDASDLIADLPLVQVTTKGNQNVLLKHLANAVQDLQDGEIADAIDKLNKAIARTDGCALRGSPDGNGPGRDWITDCDAQDDIYDLLTAAVESLNN